MAGPADVSPGQASFYGSILLSARVHATTAEVWQAIRDQSRATGTPLPSNMFEAVNRMRSLAVGMVSSSERLGAALAGRGGASRDDAITSRFIGQQLYGRGAIGQSLAPSWHVRFEVDVTTSEGTRTSWYNLGYDGALPATVGELADDIAAYAGTLGADYQVGIGDIGTIEIGAY